VSSGASLSGELGLLLRVLIRPEVGRSFENCASPGIVDLVDARSCLFSRSARDD